jgi:hypothetical protein
MIFAAKNAKIAKVLGWGFAPSVYTLYAPCDLFLAWRTGETGEQQLFTPASPAPPAKFGKCHLLCVMAKWYN